MRESIGAPAPIRPFRVSGDAGSRQKFSFVLALQLCLGGVVGVECAEISDGGGEAGTVQQLTGNRVVTDCASLAERMVDHSPQQQGCGEWMPGWRSFRNRPLVIGNLSAVTSSRQMASAT